MQFHSNQSDWFGLIGLDWTGPDRVGLDWMDAVDKIYMDIAHRSWNAQTVVVRQAPWCRQPVH